MENKILAPDVCAKNDFSLKVLCITPVVNIQLHCATQTDEKNLLLHQPKKKSNFTMSLESGFFGFKCVAGNLCPQGLGQLFT